MIVDFHTHWGTDWQQRDGLDPSRWLAVLDEHQVTHAVVLPHLGLIDAGRIPEDHNAMAEVCARSDGRMYPFATANVWAGREAIIEAERCLRDLNFRGLKFHPWLQGCSVSAPSMDELCELASAYSVPVLFHDGTPPFSLPSQIALLARRHPNARIVLGHCGLFEHWREAIAAINTTTNLWGCVCGPHLAAMTQIVQHCDAGRLLWGSDFGFGPSDMIGYRKSLFELLEVSSQDRDLILCSNARELLKN